MIAWGPTGVAYDLTKEEFESRRVEIVERLERGSRGPCGAWGYSFWFAVQDSTYCYLSASKCRVSYLTIGNGKVSSWSSLRDRTCSINPRATKVARGTQLHDPRIRRVIDYTRDYNGANFIAEMNRGSSACSNLSCDRNQCLRQEYLPKNPSHCLACATTHGLAWTQRLRRVSGVPNIFGLPVIRVT
jgi:hypothetical protein